MKKKLFFLGFSILLLMSFFYFKWDELKYYLKVDNTKIKILNNSINFGKVSLNDSVTVQFKILNIGSNDLEVKQIIPSCECTIISMNKKSTSRGDTLFINAVFRPEQVGKVKKDIVLDVNTTPPFSVLSIEGEVIK